MLLVWPFLDIPTHTPWFLIFSRSLKWRRYNIKLPSLILNIRLYFLCFGILIGRKCEKVQLTFLNRFQMHNLLKLTIWSLPTKYSSQIFQSVLGCLWNWFVVCSIKQFSRPLDENCCKATASVVIYFALLTYPTFARDHSFEETETT